MIVTNTNPGNFRVDGVYINQVAAPPAIPTGPQTGLIGIVGAANYGKVNVPVAFSAAADCATNFGNGTSLTNSLVLAAFLAMPECSAFYGVRVTDGSDTASTITITDGSAGTVATLTNISTGSYANASSARLDFKSAAGATGSPVYRLTLYFPNATPEVFDNIVGYATAGSGYSAATFKANLIAAVNGTVAGQIGSVRWTASSGSSTAQPQTATVFAATGGTDGATSVSTSTLLGTDGTNGRTGMYALRGLLQAAQLVIAGFTDATAGQSLVTFATQENCIAHIAFPQGTTSDSAVTTKATNNLSSPSLITNIDWDYYYDTIRGGSFYVPPSAKIAGVIASIPAYLYTGNQPLGGALNIIGTERTATPISVAEGGERESNGLLYLTNQATLFNLATGYGLPHGIASDGTSLICDVRMLKMISWEVQQILAPLVGGMQGTSANDAFRRTVRDRLDQYFNSLKLSTPKQINSYGVVDDLSNNTPTTIAQGLNISTIEVQTLAPARFLLSFVQVGSAVQVVAQKAG